MSTTNSAATIANLHATLASVQAALDEALNKVNRLRLENANLQAAALGPASAPSRRNARIVVNTPINYAPELLPIANQFTLLDFVWVRSNAFQSPCPPSPIPVEARYSDAEEMLQHMRYRLYECIPERFHNYLETTSEFGVNFNKMAQQQRSNTMSRLHTRAGSLFGVAYPEITPDLWDNAQARGTSDICRQLYMSGARFEPLLAPIIYSGGVVVADGIFQNEVLFVIGLSALFGYSAVVGRTRAKNSLGVKSGIKSVTAGLISFCCIAAIYLLSNDTIFEEVGTRSNIDYGTAFLAYKERIEMHQDLPRFQRIIRVWNSKLFGEADATDQETFNFSDDNVDSRLAALDAALVSENPSEFQETGISDMAANLTLHHERDQFSSISNAQHTEHSRTAVTASPSHGSTTSASSGSRPSTLFTVPASTPGSVLSFEEGVSEDEEIDLPPEAVPRTHAISSSPSMPSTDPAPAPIETSTAVSAPVASSHVHTPSPRGADSDPANQDAVANLGAPTRGRGKSTRGRGKSIPENTRRSARNRG